MHDGANAAVRIDSYEPARSVGNRLYARLHDEILTGRLRPGQNSEPSGGRFFRPEPVHTTPGNPFRGTSRSPV